MIPHACGCGGIGRRIRFRILRQPACRFKSCHPHQKEGLPHRSSSFLLWMARMRTSAADILICVVARAAEKNAVFAKQNGRQCRQGVLSAWRHCRQSGASPVTRTNAKGTPNGVPFLFYVSYSASTFASASAFAARLSEIIFSTNTVPTVSATPMGRQIHAFCTKPAMIYITKEMPATVIA